MSISYVSRTRLPLLAALLGTISFTSCGGAMQDLADNIKTSITDSVVGEAITRVTDEVNKAGGAVAIIEDITSDVSVAITEATSKALGAKVFLPAGAITTVTDQPIVLSITPIEQAAPKTTSEITVGPLIEISLRTLLDETPISLAKSATITLPFSPESVSEGELPVASHVKTTGDTPFEALSDQQVNTETVTASTPHFSLFAVTVERNQIPTPTPTPTGPPASMSAITLGTIYARVDSGATLPACEANIDVSGKAAPDLELWFWGPTSAGNDGKMQLGSNEPASMSMFMNKFSEYFPITNGMNLIPYYSSISFHDVSVSCIDSNHYFQAFSTVAPATVFKALQIVWHEASKNQSNVLCDVNGTGNYCDIEEGTAWVYWDFQVTDEYASNLVGTSKGYAKFPYAWRKVLP